MAEPKAAGKNPLRVLRNRNFARLYFAGAASIAGFSVGQIAMTWLVYTVTKSAIDVALVGISFFLAIIVFSILAGTLVDRQERKRLMIISDVVRAASLAVTTVGLYLFGFNLVLLLAEAFILGAFTTVFQPAERSLTPTLLDRGDVADANGLTQITQSLAQFASNGAGGLLIAAVGALAALGLNSLTFLVSASLLATIVIRRISTPEETAAKPRAGFFDDSKEGFRYLAGQRGLLSITVMAGIFNVFFTIVAAFLVVYTTEVLGGNATVYGILLAAFSLGVGPGSLVVGRIGAIRWTGKGWIGASFLQGLAILALVYAPDALVAFAAWFVSGFLLGFVNTSWLTTVQLAVPTEMQGRYFGVDQLGSFATIPLGQIIGGYIITVYGIDFAYEVCGISMLVMSLVFACFRSTRSWGYRPSDAVVEQVTDGAVKS